MRESMCSNLDNFCHCVGSETCTEDMFNVICGYEYPLVGGFPNYENIKTREFCNGWKFVEDPCTLPHNDFAQWLNCDWNAEWNGTFFKFKIMKKSQ